ncbi:hypothetical protein ALC57_05313 [Trachymyrmex cornetzi]|uniref:RING-type domain-containing protein n=1 Tax=Trachymyrmex cornetzi TaxID=471704 RepID=A0A151JAZ0_9HYME|nr:hypothetical protein ALC57_05313 [Trachymyrmex cornetzi]
MTQACFACKKFIAAAHALHCIHVSKHIFHEDCVRSGSSRGDVAPLICPVCGDGPLSRGPRMGRAAVSLADEASASSPVSDSLRDAFALLLEKISNIESRLDDLAAVKTQITALEGSHNRLEARVVALEAHSASERQISTSSLGARVEALERERLNAELILFGVVECPAEDPAKVAAGVASALGVGVSAGDISACFRIPARGDRPRPLIVRLSSNGIRNKWIDGKRARGVLEGSEVSPSLAGSRIDVNERLTASAREVYGAARRAVGESGAVFIARGSGMVSFT